jgi:hypothetical protein
MTEFPCSYGDDRDEAIVSFLYDDPSASDAERSRFATHLPTCSRCQTDVAALRGVRTQLARWSPPEPISLQSNMANSQVPWWRQIPAWAQVAAALLFLGVSAAIANLDVRYDASGLSVKTGWSARQDGSSAARAATAVEAAKPVNVARGADPVGDAPWRADIAALERQLKSEIRAVHASGSAPTARTVSVVSSDADLSNRVRTMVEESEKRQQRELALRLAELARDITAQRQADMVKIDRTLGFVQNNVGIEVMKTREKMNQMDLIYRASQRQ